MYSFLRTYKGVALGFLSLLGINNVVGMNALRSRKLQECDALKACYLVNIKTRAEIKLTGSDEYELDPNNANGYSIRCDVKGKAGGEINFIKFFYSNVTHDEFDTYRYMNGDSYSGAWINPVPYLQTCGHKQLAIEGHIWSNLCFRKKYTVNMVNADGSCNPPLPTPVSSTVKAPFKAPVSPPAQAPIKPPRNPATKAPSSAPVKPPRRPQANAPVIMPVMQPTLK